MDYIGVARVSDTKVNVALTFNGDFDSDATLTLTIDADAIVGYNKAFTVQVPVTAVEQSDATVSVSPSPILSPAIGEQLTLSLSQVYLIDSDGKRWETTLESGEVVEPPAPAEAILRRFHRHTETIDTEVTRIMEDWKAKKQHISINNPIAHYN